MTILDKLKGYQRLQQQQQMEPTQEQGQPVTLQPGATSLQGTSFLQQFILKMLQEKGIPVQALKFIPGFGEQVQKLLYGDPYQAHTFFADMLYHVQQILDQDKDFDPVEVTRRQAFAEAERRAEAREQYRASADTSTSGPLDGTGTNGVRQVYTTRYPDEALSAALANVTRVDYRQQAEIQSPVVDGRSTSEPSLSELEQG